MDSGEEEEDDDDEKRRRGPILRAGGLKEWEKKTPVGDTSYIPTSYMYLPRKINT